MSQNEIVVATSPKHLDYLYPVATSLGARVAPLLASIRELDVTDEAMLEIANSELKGIQALAKGMDEARSSQVRPLNTEVKAINDEYRQPLAVLTEADKLLRDKIGAYLQKQRQAAQQAQREAAAAEARERERLRVEARQQAEEAQRLAAAGNSVEAAGAQEAALQLACAAEVVHVPPPVALPTRLAGTAVVEDEDVEVADPAALLRFIADHPEYLALVEFKLGEIKRTAKRQGAQCVLPGLKRTPKLGIRSKVA